MKILILLLSLFMTSALAEHKNRFDLFLGGGLGSNTTYFSANNQATGYTTKIEESNSSANLFIETGIRINMGDFFVSPRFTYYTSNQKMTFSPTPGVDVKIYNNKRYDYDLMFGKRYNNKSVYFFLGRSIIDFNEEISVVTDTIDIKVKQYFAGIGFEYISSKALSFFGEASYYKATKSDIRIQVAGQNIPDSDKNQIDPKIETAKIKVGVRFYPEYF